jgi:hypothetical protein
VSPADRLASARKLLHLAFDELGKVAEDVPRFEADGIRLALVDLRDGERRLDRVGKHLRATRAR